MSSPKFAMQKGQRCVILADGFYEWRKEENKRQPFFIYFPQTPKEKTKDHDNPAKQREVCSGFFCNNVSAAHKTKEERMQPQRKLQWLKTSCT